MLTHTKGGSATEETDQKPIAQHLLWGQHHIVPFTMRDQFFSKLRQPTWPALLHIQLLMCPYY